MHIYIVYRYIYVINSYKLIIMTIQSYTKYLSVNCKAEQFNFRCVMRALIVKASSRRHTAVFRIV